MLWVDQMCDVFLVFVVFIVGWVVLIEMIDEFGVMIWMFFNGVRVQVKLIDFKNDEVLLCGMLLGGYLFVDNDDFIIVVQVVGIVGLMGLGEFFIIEFDKVFIGKVVCVQVFIGVFSEGVVGFVLFKDFEMMM